MNIPHAESADLNLLVALEALLSESSVTKAAARVGLTQSAMSHKLRRLRDRFGDPLLVATGGGMALTPYAQQLLGPLRHGLRELQGVWAGPRPFDPATSDREFTIISSDFAELSILPLVLQHTSEHAPHVRCRMVKIGRDMLRALEEGSADILMGPPVPPKAGLVQKRVAEDDMQCLVRSDHPGVGDTLDLDTYLELRHLVCEPGSGVQSPVEEALKALGKRRTVAMSIPHFIGGPFIVAKSDLILTTPRAIAKVAVDLLPLRMLDPPLSLPRNCVYMTWHDRFTRDPGHRWLRGLAGSTTAAVVNSR